MSAETKATLDEAIAAHAADEMDGAIVTGYVLQASTQTVEQFDEETHGYFVEFPHRQAHHIALGLAHMLVHHLTPGLDSE